MKIRTDAQTYTEQMEKLAAKYSDYRLVGENDVSFREPEGNEKSIVSKEKNKRVALLAVITLIFAVCTVLPFFIDAIEAQPIGYVIMGLLTLIGVLFLIKALKSHNMVTCGRVIAGYTHYNATAAGNNHDNKKTFFVSAVVDEDNKMMLRDIQLSKQDYENVNEGDEILIISTGSGLQGKCTAKKKSD